MGRLAAIFHRGGKHADTRELEQLHHALAVGGTSGAVASKFRDGPIGLLAVSHGRPDDPIVFHEHKASDRFVVLFDGSLFNRLELAAELGLRLSGLDRPPLRLVAERAWAKWGADAVKYLDGNFLLIVWDRQEQRLFAGRDCVGTIPLFYRLTADRLILSSMPRALFALECEKPVVRHAEIAEGLAGLKNADNQSIFEGALRLPAAHTLVVDRSSHRLTQFWSIDAHAPQLKLSSDQDYVDQARHLLDSAVRRQVCGAGTVASEITGGLDSSTVAVTALQFLGDQKRLPVYTHVPEANWDGSAVPGRYGDESPFIRDIASMHDRLEPISVSTDHTSWDGVLNQYFAAGEWLAPVPRWLAMSDEVFRDANRRGVNVMLNGLSGNATLSWEGRGAFIQWLREGRITTLLRELHAVAPGMVPFARAFVSRVVVPLGPDWVWRLYSRLKYHREPTTFWREYSFIRPEFALAHGVDERSDDFPHRPPADYRQTRAEMLSPQSNFGQDEGCAALKSMYDIEYRDPLRDRQLIEWCMRVPEEQYWRHGQGRWLVRRVMAGRLPESVLNSKQRGQQGADWHAHLTRQLPFIREQIDVLSADSDVAAMIDFDAVKKALDDWPQASVTDDDPRRYKLSIALPQALATARFVRWTKGANL